ncbi:TPA_asm: protein 3 [Centaurea virus 1]|uniref:Protein 3 n=1 Tax=Centaurea virus 1 TaxID=2977962 RepID=A0A9N7AAM4_9RHAB|nr:TPA_asm: protein 3 [Centaurea virus 1]
MMMKPIICIQVCKSCKNRRLTTKRPKLLKSKGNKVLLISKVLKVIKKRNQEGPQSKITIARSSNRPLIPLFKECSESYIKALNGRSDLDESRDFFADEESSFYYESFHPML